MRKPLLVLFLSLIPVIVAFLPSCSKKDDFTLRMEGFFGESGWRHMKRDIELRERQRLEKTGPNPVTRTSDEVTGRVFEFKRRLP